MIKYKEGFWKNLKAACVTPLSNEVFIRIAVDGNSQQLFQKEFPEIKFLLSISKLFWSKSACVHVQRHTKTYVHLQ